MSLVPTRVLVINQQLTLAVKLKQALESFGGFEVTPFTTADAALDYLRRRPQDVALVDFLLPGSSGVDLVLRIRGVQPDIAIIASPDLPEVSTIAREMGLHGVIDLPTPIRTLIPIIRQAVETVFDNLPDTAAATVIGGDTASFMIVPPPTLPEFSSLESVLVKVGVLDPMVGTETLDIGADASEAVEGKTVEFVINDPAGALREQFARTTPDHPLASAAQQAVGIFHQLAAEEPPLPTLEESGTVGDLMVGVGDTNLRQVVEILKREVIKPAFSPPKPSAQEAAPPVATPAQVILQVTLDETLPLNDLLSELDLSPLKDERYVREPDFLSDVNVSRAVVLPQTQIDVAESPPPKPDLSDTGARRPPPMTLPELDQTGDLRFQTTRMTHPEDLITDPTGMETDILARPAPPPTLPEMPRSRPMTLPESPAVEMPAVPPVLRQPAEAAPAASAEVSETAPLDPAELAEFETDFGTKSLASPVLPGLTEETAPSPERQRAVASDDPQIAQLAVSLTERSLESTAAAIVLTRAGLIAAYDGHLPIEDIHDLADVIGQDWDANIGESRIRFATHRASGQDYMIISRGTELGFTLSMIFAGNMPLHSIRRQLDRLVEALQAIPEPPVSVEDDPESFKAEAATDTVALSESFESAALADEPSQQAVVPAPVLRPKAIGPTTTYTYVWLVRDPQMTLDNAVAQAIVTALDARLTQMGWGVRELSVREDYVYVLADVPGDVQQNEVIGELKRTTSEVAYGADNRIDPARLWADSYLTLLPGRAMTVDEIQRFIHFARMRG